MRPEFGLPLLLLAATAVADDGPLAYGGHTKLNATAATFPDNSLLRDVIGSSGQDFRGELRLNLEWRHDRWSAEAAYQLVALESDSLGAFAGLPVGSTLLARAPDDGRRLLDLTSVIDDSSDSAIAHRLDRLWFGYASGTSVLRVGRQALSWGNGFFYAPMDLVNPFDPAAVDTEYKPGDDMIYAQFLRGNGDDVQAAHVLRRDPLSGDVASNQATTAVKYHGFAGELEYDVLVAHSYNDAVLGLGAARSAGGAVWTGDLVVTDTDRDTRVQLVTNLSYSWVAGGRNMTGIVEYHYNGFGQRAKRYSPAELAGNPELLARLERAQSFTLGRHYAAATVTIEMTPLWTLSPVVLANLADPSALLQLTTNHSLSDNLTLLGNLNLPLGADGSEFGGVPSGVPERYLSATAGVFVQIAWYF